MKNLFIPAIMTAIATVVIRNKNIFLSFCSALLLSFHPVRALCSGRRRTVETFTCGFAAAIWRV